MRMKELDISYSVWKDVVDVNPLWETYHMMDGYNSALLWAGGEIAQHTGRVHHSEFIYCSMVDADSYEDWATNFVSTSIRVFKKDDATAYILSFTAPLTCVHLSAPEEPDGKPVMVQAPFTDGLYMFVSARGDSLDEYGTLSRGEGTKLIINYDAYESGEKEVVATFYECIELHDGHVDFDPDDWDFDDEWSIAIRIPATTVTPNGSNEGNCNLVAAQELYPWDSGTTYSFGDMVTHNGVNYYCVAGHINQEPPSAYWVNAVNVIVPAAGDGAYDVDLSEAIPVPYEDAGYWDYNPWTDVFTPADAGADWMLFDFAMDDVYLVKNMICSSRRGFWELDAYKVEPIYARWKLVFSTNRNAVGPATIGGHYTCFREDTT